MTVCARIGLSFSLFVLAGASLPRIARAEPPVDHQLPFSAPDLERQTDSTSIGTPMRGKLERGEVLPRKGRGYQLAPETLSRKARYGVAQLVAAVKEVAGKVSRKHPGGLLTVGDLSLRRGGWAEHHGSHQNGRDVDMLFYLLDKKGRPVGEHGFVQLDLNGYSTDPPMEYRLDTKRNWELVRALLTSSSAQVQWIFVNDNIKALLLAEAEASKAPRSVIERARLVLKQPGAKAHTDHFHVRIFCPAEDRPACRDVGPRWAWAK